ncbi:universal stress protein [Actinomycetospora sp. TBRC 11914]|uniref:universal stress protein n=1 Tax=Actinomycetospora sp. TBRC 11914 TaxID=2729387 RepID=UPI00145DEA60|nr:universal stress protein [Actinomycetospora sp. TBRC 11914]NMO93590.1 universal stress protein [Actinomycetospora sp. TBRC 11914]
MAEDDLLEAAAGGIVVGMDDSPSARVALRHGLEEGARRGTHVLALTVYHSQSAWAPQVARVLDEDRLVGEVTKAIQQLVDEVVAEERRKGNEVPPVRAGLRTGSPADVLCRISRDATLLVIGDRGRGQLASRLIGSVVLGVVLGAQCPVLVVHPGD